MATRTKIETEKNIVELLMEGKSYSEICKAVHVGKATIQRVKNRNVEGLKIPDNSNITVHYRRKLSESAIRVGIIKRADVAAGNLLNVAINLQFAAGKMLDIITTSEEKIEQVEKSLKDVKEIVKSQVDDERKQQNLINAIYKALGYVTNFHSIQDIIIKAAREFRSGQESFVKLEIDAKKLAEFKELLDSMFTGLNILSDENYKLYRNEVMEINPSSKILFNSYERVNPDTSNE